MITEKIATFVTNQNYKTLPQHVIEMTKRCILDYIGNTIAGSQTKVGKMVSEYINNSANLGSSTAIGIGKRLIEKAAFANSVMSRTLDLDDGHRFSMGHPGTVIISTALSIGESNNMNGKEIITAIVIGYDIYIRLGRAINPSSLKDRGLDATCTCGTLAAAAVADKLYGLNKKEIINSLGIAGSQPGGLYECLTNDSMPKILFPGWAVFIGINSSYLAKKGFTGPGTIIEGDKGFCQAVSQDYYLNRITKDIGNTFFINSVYFKKYACMRGLHAGIDALIILKSKYLLHKGNVEKIVVRTSSFVKQYDNYKPSTLVAAQASMPFCLSVALLKGKVTLNDMLDGLKDSNVYDLARKVYLKLDLSIERYTENNPSEWATAELDVYLKNKSLYSQRISIPKGEPEFPYTNEELIDKFNSLTMNLPKQRKEYIVNMINKFELLDSIRPLLSHLEKISI
jgi:2-methylcitrate dehydratase PrpD